ncbi:MAG TPA: TetR/AcrR family transcriptional regulator [Solirubrobacteraceae bacterium]|nr:TetR/AcrR family transcriptional regulator [Solirubrobacteraceae bacterium]
MSTTSEDRARSAHRRERRASREEAIIAATREVFDLRGAREARVEDIARAAGLNKALIYRVFLSKEEIYVRTAASYLDELRAEVEALTLDPEPVTALGQLLTTFADFCIVYPAFLDCGLGLLNRPASELRETLSDAAWFRVSRAVGRCVGPVQRALQAGADSGEFALEDPGFLAARLLTAMMGALHLVRLGVAVQEAVPGAVTAVPLDPAQVRDACVADALATVVRRGDAR